MMPSEKQIGIIGQREPELCAVSGRSVRGKHAVTHYKGDGVHYVRVLNQFDDKWPEAADAYGFPVPKADEDVKDESVFVVDTLKPDNAADYLLNQANPPAHYTPLMQNIAAIPGDNIPGIAKTRQTREKSVSDQSISADGMSKVDD